MSSNRTLYHYTSGAGLMGIFDNSAIWASSIHQLNDASEFRHALEIAKREIARAVSKQTDPAAATLGLRITDLIDRCGHLSVFVTSFSEMSDSLNQWRNYCPDGFGYNIGFDEEVLRKTVDKQGFTLSQCIYADDKKKTLLGAWAQSTVAHLLTGFVPSAPASVTDDWAWPHIESLLRLAPFFKHNSFSDEWEWRIAKVVNLDSPALKVRAGKTMLIRYVPVELELSPTSDLIRSVCVGPTPYPDLAMSAVGHYFSRVLIRKGVHRSDSPYRSV